MDNASVVEQDHQNFNATEREKVVTARSGKSMEGQGSPEPAQADICDRFAIIKEVIYPIAACSVIVLAIFATGYSLYFCRPVMLPIVGAFLLNFLFSPFVSRLNRWGLPTAVGSLVVLGISLTAFVAVMAFAYAPASSWIKNKDQNLALVQERLTSLRKPLDAVHEVTKEIDKIADPRPAKADEESDPPKDPESESEKSSGESQAPGNQLDRSFEPETRNQSSEMEPDSENRAETDDSKDGASSEDKEEVVVPVEVKQPSISNRIFSTTGDTLAGLAIMLVVLFYLLSAGERGLEKLVTLMPTFGGKKRVVELTRAIEKSISSYLITTTVINIGLGLAIGVGMWAIGMPNPVLWGIMAMLLNYLPFIGLVFGSTIVFIAAVVSFDTLAYAAWAPAIYLSANIIEANFITPVLVGRSVSLHPVWLMIFFVFVSWVWGLGGAIIAIPVLAVLKISCDHIEPLVPIGEFLGR